MLPEYLIEIKYNGLLSIAPCCEGIRGNIDTNILEVIYISDLDYLVDFMFTNGSVPICNEKTNFDGNIDEIVDITDLVAIVSILFMSGPGHVNRFN